MIVEVCANSLESALNAEKAGADRIELCMELGTGGITPSYGLLKSVKEALSIPIHVLIRPRSGDFIYSDTEFEVMKRDIELCVELGVDGIVSGVLHKDFTLDIERTKELMDMAGYLKFTFHRAFDLVGNPFKALKQLEDLEVDYILTSGQQKSALEGMSLLLDLQKKTSKCTLLPGGGVREINAQYFKDSKFKAIHMSGIKFRTKLENSPELSMNTLSFFREDKVAITDTKTIQDILKVVK